MNTSDFQQHASILLGKLKEKKEAIEREYGLRITEVDKEIEAVSITLRLLREPSPSSKSPESVIVKGQVPASELIGKSARQALILIAQYNAGNVRIIDAKPLLVGAGILQPTKNIWGAIHTTLSRSPEFERVPEEKGTFRLRNRSPQGTLLPAA
jgi:hypothetical protein